MPRIDRSRGEGVVPPSCDQIGDVISNGARATTAGIAGLSCAWLTVSPDLLEELAAGELLIVGEDGGAHQDALQDLVVVADRWQTKDLVVVGLAGSGPGVEGQPFPAGSIRTFAVARSIR
jgi:hypothetical protein